MMRAISFLREHKTDNGYARPVEGLIAYVDLESEVGKGTTFILRFPMDPKSGLEGVDL